MTSEELTVDPFISFAQNGEDIMLWRALGHIPNGSYVDVGAADPIIDSVTKAFYEHGWTGVNVEPMPTFAAALRADRPRDLVVEAGVSDVEGTLKLYGVPETGLSSFTADSRDRAVERGFDVVEVTVPMRTLDDILNERFAPGDDIHFLKVDVEGFEESALLSIDFDRWKPWVVVIEATAPGSPEDVRNKFTYILDRARYTFAFFDGLNVYYVSPEHPELLESLSYPPCVFDNYVLATSLQERDRYIDEIVKWQGAWSNAETQFIKTADRLRRVRANLARSKRRVSAAENRRRKIETSPWWRVTSPARRVTAKVRATPSRTNVSARTVGAPAAKSLNESAAPADSIIAQRLIDLFSSLGHEFESDTPVATLMLEAIRLLERDTDSRNLLWCLYVVFHSHYPSDDDMSTVFRNLQLDGSHKVVTELAASGLNAKATWATSCLIRFTREPIVDVSHTCAHDVHTGVQRVVRETVKRWNEHANLTLVRFDHEAGAFRPLSKRQEARVLRWGSATDASERTDEPQEIVVPICTAVIVPELAGEPERTGALVSLGSWSSSTLQIIFYDMIPFAMSETCVDTMPQVFSRYMTVVRSAERISTISETVADDLRGFLTTVTNQGLVPPLVHANLLATQAEHVSAETVTRYERELMAVPGLPLVLYVSSIEPRKNHANLLAASELLWREGLSFQIALIAGNSWKQQRFDAQLDAARERGRPIRIIRGASESALWSAYQLARFSVFISTTEGFGLPAAESLAAGTPVLLSNIGSMREIGISGGVEFVDPRDVQQVADSMRKLLTDDAHLSRLRREATERVDPTWDSYSADTWEWLVEGRQ